MNDLNGRPGDQRGFIHKKILRGIGKVAGIAGAIGIPGAGTVSTIARTLAGSQKQAGTRAKFEPELLTRGQGLTRTGFLPCLPPFRIDPRTGECRFFIGGQTGVDDTLIGEAIMGQYGAGVVPGNQVIDRAVCLKGMQLGNDGVCYNKAQLRNKDRMWPAGRKPLLTGGDMRAISIAARAGRRMDQATTRLRKLGMMKRFRPRRLSRSRHTSGYSKRTSPSSWGSIERRRRGPLYGSKCSAVQRARWDPKSLTTGRRNHAIHPIERRRCGHRQRS